MTTTTDASLTALLTDSNWTRRLAAALLGDPTAAEDARQEAWVRTRTAAANGPDDPAHAGRWVRSVVANALRSERRARLRRGARERVAVATHAAAIGTAVASPEEMLARLEVQKTLATLVGELPERSRHVVLLHYYEGLTSLEIGNATGEPAGTVRWRLKTALAELRAGLEKRYGRDEDGWRLVLLPILPRKAEAAALPTTTAPPRKPLRWAVGATLATGILVGGAALTGGTDRLAGTLGIGEAALAGGGDGRSGTRGGRSRPTPPRFSAAALAGPCGAEIKAFDARVRQAEAALEYHLPGNVVWDEAGGAAANPRGAAALAPVVHRWLDARGVPQADREVECRATACKVKTAEPWPTAASWTTRQPSAEVAAALARIARDVQIEPAYFRDAPGGGRIAKNRIWLRLHTADGGPATAPPPPFPKELLPSGALLASAHAPSTRGAACRADLAPLANTMEELRTRAHKILPAHVLYQEEPTVNEPLAAELQPLVDAAHARNKETPDSERAVRLTVACRGLVCKAAPPADVRVHSVTLAGVLKDPALASRVRRVSLVSQDQWAAEPIYFTLNPAAKETRSGHDVLRAFRKHLTADEAVAKCLTLSTPVGAATTKPPATAGARGDGALSLRLLVPASGQTNEDGVPGRISFRLEGRLADSAVGRCVREILETRAAAFTLPPETTRAETTVELPVGGAK